VKEKVEAFNIMNVLTEDDRQRLEAQSMKGEKVTFKRKGTGEIWNVGEVVGEVYVIVNDYKHMIQQIQFTEGEGWGDNRFAYRTGYYTFQYDTNRIKWGQFTQFLTQSEYKELLGKARAKGWDIF
jgi:hypothetical protein